MSISKDDKLEKFRRMIENRLTEGGLGISQIENYTLPELEQYFETINGIIANPEALGVLEAEASLGVMGIKTTIKETALPLLLERKKFLLDRINLLKGQEKITSLRELVSKRVPDEETRTKLLSEIEKIEIEAQKFREQTSKVEEALAIEKVKREAELTKLEVFKQRSQVWLVFLERESVATITGAILLFVLTITQIIATFTRVQSTDILNNAFLLILGYFFGQSVSRVSARSKE